MSRYQLYGRSGAGSLIAEFMLKLAGQEYQISFPNAEELKSESFKKLNPLSRIPVLITPEGDTVYETLAIIYHFADRFDGIAPPSGTPERDRFNQFLALLATSIYPAYHRQHHTYQYCSDEAAYANIKDTAKSLNNKLYDYIETQLNPYICGDMLTAADFYLYMVHRWDTDKTALRENRPKLTALLAELRTHPVVDAVLSSQPPKK